MNNENLVNIGDRTTNEQREITTNGGIASGKARRKKKAMKSALGDLLRMGAATDEDKAQLKRYGIDPDEFDQQGLVLLGLMNKAKTGDVQAIKLMREIVGEDEWLRIEQEKLAMLKESRKENTAELDKLDEILNKINC